MKMNWVIDIEWSECNQMKTNERKNTRGYLFLDLFLIKYSLPSRLNGKSLTTTRKNKYIWIIWVKSEVF